MVQQAGACLPPKALQRLRLVAAAQRLRERVQALEAAVAVARLAAIVAVLLAPLEMGAPQPHVEEVVARPVAIVAVLLAPLEMGAPQLHVEEVVARPAAIVLAPLEMGAQQLHVEEVAVLALVMTVGMVGLASARPNLRRVQVRVVPLAALMLLVRNVGEATEDARGNRRGRQGEKRFLEGAHSHTSRSALRNLAPPSS